MGKSYIGDEGTRIRMTLNTSLTGYSTIVYKVQKPNGTEVELNCSVEDETDGIIYYDCISGDLNQNGKYLIQAFVVFLNGNRFYSETRDFEVHKLYH